MWGGAHCVRLFYDLMDCSPPGSSVHGIFQARILKWVAISASRGLSWLRDWTRVSCIAGQFFTTSATQLVVIQSLSCVWLFGMPLDCSMPGSPALHHLPELAQTHLHWVGDAISPSVVPLLLPSIFPSIGVLSNELALHLRWPKD